jgi:hypothetical protein
MQTTKLSSVEPYEFCSIRPPTENYSLTFKLTRNCYWNKCAFCPVYRLGARFSKRSIQEIKEDIRRAGLIDDVIAESDAGGEGVSGEGIVAMIKRAKAWEGLPEPAPPPPPVADIDPVVAWFSSWFKTNPTIEESVEHVLSFSG